MRLVVRAHAVGEPCRDVAAWAESSEIVGVLVSGVPL